MGAYTGYVCARYMGQYELVQPHASVAPVARLHTHLCRLVVFRISLYYSH